MPFSPAFPACFYSCQRRFSCLVMVLFSMASAKLCFFCWALLLFAGGLAGLAAVERQGWLAVGEQGAELLSADLEEAGKAFKLLAAQAGKFDSAILKFLPHIDAEAQAFRGVDQRQAALRPQFAQGGRRGNGLRIEDALQSRLVGSLRQGQQGVLLGFEAVRHDVCGRVASDKIDQRRLCCGFRVVEQEVLLCLRIACFPRGQPCHLQLLQFACIHSSALPILGGWPALPPVAIFLSVALLWYLPVCCALSLEAFAQVAA